MDIAKEYINNKLLPIINEIGEKLEGNIFMTNHKIKYSNKFINKVKNINNYSLNKDNILEIGFNSGFSAVLMLLSNPNCKITCVDLGEHKYTIPCYNKIKKDFGDRINLIIGSSVDVLPNLVDKYDLIHIDGCHKVSVAEQDIINSYKLCKDGTIIIFDDCHTRKLNILWNKYIELYNLKEMPMLATRYHDIKKVFL